MRLVTGNLSMSVAAATCWILAAAWIAAASPIEEAPMPSGLRYFHAMDSAHCQSPRTVSVVVQPDGVHLSLEFTESTRDFLAPNFEVESSSLPSRRARPCYYQGGVLGDSESMATATLANGMLSAVFSHKGTMYEAPAQSDQHSGSGSGGSGGSGSLTAWRLQPGPTGICGTTEAAAGGHSHHHGAEIQPGASMAASPRRRRRRSMVELDTNSMVPESERKYILLLLAGDSSFYEGMNRSMERAVSRLWEISNYVNGLYKQLGTNVITVKTLVWTTDPFPVVNASDEANVNATALMFSFLMHCARTFTNLTYTAAHLVTGRTMASGISGIAAHGKLCSFPLSGGVNGDLVMNGSSYGVSTTVTHELGHNAGMQHDDKPDNSTCYCPDPQGCIMQTSAKLADPVRFSDCSVNSFMEYGLPNGFGYCTSRPPDSREVTETLAVCGNRMVDPGEDCDCGLPSHCNNTCCNPSTCKFNPGARCASGQCCNAATCSPLARGTQCRKAKGVCDLPEFCDGASEWCPKFDDHVLDGTVCDATADAADAAGGGPRSSPSAAPQAFCYSGRCDTRDARCADLFKGSRRHAEIEGATTTSGIGYCSYTLGENDYIKTPCSEANKRCGTLFCYLPSSEQPKSNWKTVEDVEVKLLPPSMTAGEASVAYDTIDIRSTGYRDPAMVPNGAECGPDKMCVNSECVPLSTVMSRTAGSSALLPDCHGHGRWSQSRQCYCDMGFAPPDCVAAGAGGSASNQPKPVGPGAALAGVSSGGFLGIGIAVGLAAAGLVAIVAGVAVWMHRRRSSSSGSLMVTSQKPVTMVMGGGGGGGGGGGSRGDAYKAGVSGGGGGGFANPMTHGRPTAAIRSEV